MSKTDINSIAKIKRNGNVSIVYYSVLGDRAAVSIDAARRIVLDTYHKTWKQKGARIVREELPTATNPFGVFYVKAGVKQFETYEVHFARTEMIIEA